MEKATASSQAKSAEQFNTEAVRKKAKRPMAQNRAKLPYQYDQSSHDERFTSTNRSRGQNFNGTRGHGDRHDSTGRHTTMVDPLEYSQASHFHTQNQQGVSEMDQV